MRWVFSRRLGENLTPSIMAKLREMVNTAFYIRHLYSYVIGNNEDRRRMVYLQTEKRVALDKHLC